MQSRAPRTAEVDVSRYEIERKLGEGGAGAVYLARDRETGERVALKKLFRMDAKSVLRLKREFRSLVDIAHPNIVKLYDMGNAGDGWFLTMECAEQALRELLDRLAMRQPIVLWIDDLHWGDLDSARMLRSWLRDPSHSPILFVFSYRSDEAATSSCLSSLLQASDAGGAQPAPEHVIDVATLESDDIRALCERRWMALGADAGLVSRIVREAQGSPFLALQLLALAETKRQRGDADLDSVTVDALVAQTRDLLSDEARTLLAVLAVAGRPMQPKLAFQAAGIQQNGRAVVHALRSLNLVRTRDVAGSRMLEIYHDRVRERVQATLTAAQNTALHRALLGALQFSGHADPGWLFSLALGAGRESEALQYGRTAAGLAAGTLAFERAAELYQSCLPLAAADEQGELWEKLAIARARSGYAVLAAEAYLEAAKLAEAERSLQPQKLAASHFLRCGRFERGEQLVWKTLSQVGEQVPESEAGVIAAIVWERTRLRLRGMNFTLRSAEAASGEGIARGDTLEELAVALHQLDPLRGSLLQTRAIRCALDSGEPYRIVRSLCLSAINASLPGSPRNARESDALLERASSVASQSQGQGPGHVCSARAISAFMLSRFPLAVEQSIEADRLLAPYRNDRPDSDYYRRHVLASVRVGSRVIMGRIAEATSELQALVREAQATDNRSLLFNLALTRTAHEQATGNLSSARARLEADASTLPAARFGAVHVLHMTAILYAAAGTSEFTWAHERTQQLWQAWLRSPLRGSGCLSLSLHITRARMLLNQYVAERRPELLKTVRHDLKLAQKNGLEPGAAFRSEARLALADGDRARALDWLRKALQRAEASSMLSDAARERYALGMLTDGPEGEALQTAAIEQLRALGFVSPLDDLRAQFPELVPG